MSRGPARKRAARSTKPPAASSPDPHPRSWGTLLGSMLTNVVSEATTSLKDFADTKISMHGPAYMKQASEKVAQTSEELMAWAKHHPAKMAAAVAALVAAGALLRAAMKSHGGSDGSSRRASAAR
jgi:hypothetical protein